MKAKRIIAIALSMIMMISLLNLNAFAAEPPLPMPRAATDLFYTPAMTAGAWWSGYNSGHIYDLACSKSSLKGSDIAIYIYYSEVGMPETFDTDESRNCTIEVKENDAGGINTNELAFKRTGTFGMDFKGLYNIVSWDTLSDVNESVIENNSTLELYIRVYIQTKPGDDDDDRAVPPELIYYNFVTTY